MGSAASSASLALGVVPPFAWIAVGMAALVILVAGLAKAAAPSTHVSTPDTVMRHLVTAAVSGAKASAQDADPVQRLSDAVSGVARLDAARQLARSDTALESATGVNLPAVYASLRSQQKDATDALRGHAATLV